MKNLARAVVPSSLRRVERRVRDRVALRVLKPRPCNLTNLGHIGSIDLKAIFRDASASEEWDTVSKSIQELGITEHAEGVNLGDRRALYYFMRSLAAEQVLEVGTHIGASTAHIATAIQRNSPTSHLVTVDIRDMNDAEQRPWLAHGSQYSPKELVKKLGCQDMVSFEVQPATRFMANTDRRFDLIFLDGNHSSPAVFREMPLALSLLRPNGYILLHDYYPNLQALWPNDSVIEGPFLALEELKRSYPEIEVLPFGELPWETKQDLSITSLAVVGRRSRA